MIAADHPPPPPLPHLDQRDLWLRLARLIRPVEGRRPSEWTEENVVLTDAQSPASPGPFNCGFRPWTRAVHDVQHDNPGKRGCITVKPAQCGHTQSVMNRLAYLCTTRPGPMLYLIGDQENSKHYAATYFNPTVKGVPELAALFEDIGEDDRQLLQQKPFLGGRVDFAGGGSPGKVSSRPYRMVFVDELENVYDNFPKAAGDPIGFVKGRFKTVEETSWLEIFSHPRRSDTGIWFLYTEWSDRRAWMFDCPRAGCGAPVDPLWECVHIEGLKEAGPKNLEFGRADPNKAVFRCPACKGVITDAERCRATWDPRNGGTGRFQSRLSAKDAAQKEYVGQHIDGLADPFVTVGALARDLMGCRSEEAKRTHFNIQLGETYDSSEAAVTVEHVKEALKKSEGKVLVPGGKHGCQVLCVGVDVQAPEIQPTMYTRAEAYGPMAEKWVTHFEKLSGFDALQAWLEGLSLNVAHESGSGVGGRLGASICTIDCGYLTPRVLDFCRRTIISKTSGARIQLLPVRYESYVRQTQPFILPSAEKRTDPSRPHLGALERYDLCRETWVDREMRRWMDGRLMVLGRVPHELPAHLTANVRVPAPDIHKAHQAGNMNLVWEKPEDKRDDWMQAGAYCEAGAVIKMRVDRMAEIASTPEEAPAVQAQRNDWFGRYRRGGGGYFGR